MTTPGIKKLRFIQLGRETTGASGTEVDATAIWRGLGTIEDAREKVTPEEDVGYMSGTTRQYEPKVQALLHMDEVEATFEQLPHIFEASIERATGTKDGAGTGYAYVYHPPTTSQPEITTYTVEGGDDYAEEQFKYGFVESWSLSGVAGESVKMSAEWIGREVAPGTKTAGLSLTAVEEILMAGAKIYIDGTSATHGTTQVTAQWLEFGIDYTSGLAAVYTGDGQKYFTFHKGTGPELKLKLKLEHHTQAAAEKIAWRAGTTRLIRLDFTGTTLASSGTTYDNKKLVCDITGKWDTWGSLEDTDGDDTVTGEMTAHYDVAAAHYSTITVVNELAALP